VGRPHGGQPFPYAGSRGHQALVGRLLGGRLPGSLSAHAERVGGTSHHQHGDVAANDPGGLTDLRDAHVHPRGQALCDRLGDALGVAEHRLEHDQCVHLRPLVVRRCRAGVVRLP
jgi:hypothetical protein